MGFDGGGIGITGKKSYEQTHERILQGALEVFSDKGFSAATIKDISAKVGCNSITVFRHFEDKNTLFLQVVERYHRLEFDEEYIHSKLSFTNVHADLTTIAGLFYEILFQHIHIMRIYINDGPHFEQIAKYVWYLPAPLKNFVMEYMETVYPNTIPLADASLIAEMFVSYITRTCLRINVHDGIHENSKKMAKEVKSTMAVSVDMTLSMILMQVKRSRKR